MAEETTATITAPVTPATPNAPVTKTGSETPQSFNLDVDPSKLPSPLQGVHKSLLGDYTRKTQALSEERKAFEAEREEHAQARARFLAESQEQRQPPQGVVQPRSTAPSFANEAGELDPTVLSQFIRDEARREAMELTKPDRLAKADQEISTLRGSYGALFDSHITKITDKIRATRAADGKSTMTIDEAFRAVVPPKELEHHYRTKLMKELEGKQGLPSVKPGPVGESRPSNDKPQFSEVRDRVMRKHGLS